jgi:aminopeptidase N
MWWYGEVGNDQIFEPWLDEGLASYSEVLYFENLNPRIAEVRLGRMQAEATGTPLDTVSIYGYDSTVAYVDDLYPQAAIMLADLRDAMGDTAFFSFLRAYARRFRAQLATGADFRAEAQAHSRVDLSPLWVTYFAEPGF